MSQQTHVMTPTSARGSHLPLKVSPLQLAITSCALLEVPAQAWRGLQRLSSPRRYVPWASNFAAMTASPVLTFSSAVLRPPAARSSLGRPREPLCPLAPAPRGGDTESPPCGALPPGPRAPLRPSPSGTDGRPESAIAPPRAAAKRCGPAPCKAKVLRRRNGRGVLATFSISPSPAPKFFRVTEETRSMTNASKEYCSSRSGASASDGPHPWSLPASRSTIK
eukprot:CAMPEP_0170630434 /NCGR_PEP_ID=MMETSP0224-20130122/33991_1 /TAXON_ID=285029 /ORGANISM="Togula jolla, Strain CCCM 725" /LENGTH=221 /DNA_ID=CAMNT_0010958477 /DNA_START=57 /DNA_END=720 /DNA_ORIENTATION=-